MITPIKNNSCFSNDLNGGRLLCFPCLPRGRFLISLCSQGSPIMLIFHEGSCSLMLSEDILPLLALRRIPVPPLVALCYVYLCSRKCCSLRHVTFLAKRAFFLVKSVAFIMIYVAQLISLVTLPHVPFRSHSRCLAGGLLSHIAPLARWTLILCKICFLHIALLALRICNRFKFISLFEQNSTLKSTFGLLCRIYAPRRTWGTFFLKFWYSSRGILGWSCDSGLVAWIINYITS